MLPIIQKYNFNPYTHAWIKQGVTDKQSVSGSGIRFRANVGMAPWKAGEHVYYNDYLALPDPYLARLPALPRGITAGHYRRLLPDGYIESLISGKTLISDPALAALYDDVTQATRAPLFTKERWKSIWRLNTRFHVIRLGYPESALNNNLHLSVLPAFSPLKAKDRSALRGVEALKYSLAYDDAATFQRLVSSMQGEPEFLANMSRLAHEMWILAICYAGHGDDSKFRALLDAGVDVNLPETNGVLPLDAAVLCADERTVRALLEHGAKVNATHDGGNSVLIAPGTIKRSRFGVRNPDGETALMKAAKRGDTGIATALLEYGADMVVHGKDKKGKAVLLSAIEYATEYGHQDMAEFLSNKLAKDNSARKNSATALPPNGGRDSHRHNP